MSNLPEVSLIGVQNPPVNGVNQPELVYELVDAVARAQSATAGRNIIAWKGDDTPDVSIIPAGVTVTYNDTEYTGTMQPDDETVKTNCRYLVYRGNDSDGNNIYQEYVVVENPQDETDKWWEAIGYQNVNLEALGALAFENYVFLQKGNGVYVLGSNTTFLATAPVVNVTAPKAGLKANLKTNVAVGPDGTANAIIGFGAHTTETFVKTVSGTAKKLETKEIQEAGAAVNLQNKVSAQASKLVKTQITPVGGSETVSKVTKEKSKLVKTSLRGVSDTTEQVSKVTKQKKKMVTDTVPNVTSVGTLPSFTTSYDANNKKLTLAFAPGTLPTMGTAKTVATGALDANGTGAEIVEEVTITDKNVAVPNANATTVATGDTSSDGTGASVVSEVNITDKTVATPSESPVDVATGELNSSGTGATVLHTLDVANQEVATLKSTKTVVASGKTAASDSNGDTVIDGVNSTNGTNPAITGIGTPTTAAALTGVKVTQQPVTELQSKAAGAGDVDVVTDVSATASAPQVSANNNDPVKVATYDALAVQVGDIEDYNDVPM